MKNELKLLKLLTSISEVKKCLKNGDYIDTDNVKYMTSKEREKNAKNKIY